MIKDDTVAEWTHTLRNDLVRINKHINRTRQQVDEGIAQLRKLEKEREVIIGKCFDCKEK